METCLAAGKTGMRMYAVTDMEDMNIGSRLGLGALLVAGPVPADLYGAGIAIVHFGGHPLEGR